MKDRKVVTVFEHEELKLKDIESFSQHSSELYRHLLLKLNDQYKQNYFIPTAKGFKFQQYVGVIQVGDLIIEILPKADQQGKEKKSREQGKWRNLLIEMLQECRKLSVTSLTWANLKTKSNLNIIDLYFEVFLNELEQLLYKGLVKRYRKIRGNLNKLKGKLVFDQHIQQNAIHKERFYTEHETYDHTHLLNQILLEALRITKQIGPPFLQDKLQRLELFFPEIKSKPISESDFSRIRWDRKSEPYRKAIQLARMIILNYHPDLKRGMSYTLAILFDMNVLFEEYVYRKLKRAFVEEGYSAGCVLAQQSHSFWKSDQSDMHVSLCPDILVNNIHDGYSKIIDTKWKDGSQPSTEDLRQIFSYIKYYDADSGILMYPLMIPSDQPQMKNGNYSCNSFFTKDKFDKQECKIVYANVVKMGNDGIHLNKSIGRDILQILVPSSHKQ